MTRADAFLDPVRKRSTTRGKKNSAILIIGRTQRGGRLQPPSWRTTSVVGGSHRRCRSAASDLYKHNEKCHRTHRKENQDVH
jgi:hypothetical protein